MRLKPLHSKIVLALVEMEETTEGGIFIASTANEEPMEGVVKAVGPGAADMISEGDNVIFAKGAGQEVTLDNESLLIIDADEVISIVEK